jgi:hypothetical protein
MRVECGDEALVTLTGEVIGEFPHHLPGILISMNENDFHFLSEGSIGNR